MTRYRFELATPDDDFALRQVVEATPMEGRVSLTLRREPSWFSGAVVDGRERQVLVCRDTATGQVVGEACRSMREVFVNGAPSQVGYLSNLRLLPEHRKCSLLARGYRFLHELHQDGRVPFYLTTIAAKNDVALDALTSGRAGLPQYHPAGDFHTLAIALPRKASKGGSGESGIRQARPEDLPRLLEFWSAHGPMRQFFPQLRADDFLNANGAMRGLTLDRLLICERNGRIAGTLAGWDQHDFRQTVVRAYRGALHWLRPAYNVWSDLRGRFGLPRPGAAFRYLLAALPVVERDDERIYAALLSALMRQAAGGPWSHLLTGLHAADPLLGVARRHRATCYTTHLYYACWPAGESARKALDDRPPYLELGSL